MYVSVCVFYWELNPRPCAYQASTLLLSCVSKTSETIVIYSVILKIDFCADRSIFGHLEHQYPVFSRFPLCAQRLRCPSQGFSFLTLPSHLINSPGLPCLLPRVWVSTGSGTQVLVPIILFRPVCCSSKLSRSRKARGEEPIKSKHGLYLKCVRYLMLS